MPNILFVCEGSGFAGAESYALNLISKLQTYRNMELSCALFYQGLFSEKLKENSVNVITLHGQRNRKSIKTLISYVKENKIELIHFVDLKSTIVGGVASILLKDIKTVATVHGLPEFYKTLGKQIKYFVSLAIYFLILRHNVDKVICVSNDLKSKLITKLGVKKISVVHNGLKINTSRQCYSRRSTRQKTIIVGTVSRLEKVKGHKFLIESARQILHSKKNVSFDIIGSGQLENELKELATSLGISENVKFRGFREDAKKLIADMDIFVLPSLHEGIPYVLLEAMSFGKPIVCTAVGGLKEVIQDQVDGLYVNPKDPLSLSEAILRLLNDHEYAMKLGRNAKKKVEKVFSSKVMAEKTYGIYTDLIGELNN